MPMTSCLPDHVLDFGASLDKLVIVWAVKYPVKNTAFTPIPAFYHCVALRFDCTDPLIRSITKPSVDNYPTFKVKMELHHRIDGVYVCG